MLNSFFFFHMHMQVFYLLGNFYGIISVPMAAANGCASSREGPLLCVAHPFDSSGNAPSCGIDFLCDTNFKSYKTVIIYYQPRCPVHSLSTSLPWFSLLLPMAIPVRLTSSPRVSFKLQANFEFQIVLCLTWHGRQTLN